MIPKTLLEEHNHNVNRLSKVSLRAARASGKHLMAYTHFLREYGSDAAIEKGINLGVTTDQTTIGEAIQYFRSQLDEPLPEQDFPNPYIAGRRVDCEATSYEIAAYVTDHFKQHPETVVNPDHLPAEINRASWKAFLRDHPEYADNLIISGLGEVRLMKHMKGHWSHFASIRRKVAGKMKWEMRFNPNVSRVHDREFSETASYMRSQKGFFYQGFDFNIMETEQGQALVNAVRDDVNSIVK